MGAVTRERRPMRMAAAAILRRTRPGRLSAHLRYRRLFCGKGRSSIYPEIHHVQLRGEEHYHLPLLLSDNSYTTYRGS
jgi:hypothetical protein